MSSADNRGHRKRATRAVAGAVALTLLSNFITAETVHADWLSRLARGAAEVGEVGGKAGKLGLGALEGAAELVAKLPATAERSALAAHATPEGHWKFINRDGEVFTAGNADELARVKGVLAPDLEPGGKLALYLSEDTVFAERALLKELPPDAELYVVSGKDGYRLERAAGPGGATLRAEVRPNISVELTDQVLFDEALFQLGRPLNRSNIRVLALEPGGPQALSSAPRFDPVTKAALVDQIDPGSLRVALQKLSGQTVLLSGRVDGDALAFLPASGGAEQKVFVRDLTAAAEAADVNIVVVQASSTRQPGGRNWLWQKVEVAGLDEAMKRATFADFLSSLGGAGEKLAVTASPGPTGRIVMRAVGEGGSASIPLSGTVDEWIGELSGRVVAQAVEVNARDQAREEELDARLIPWLPSAVQYMYLAGVILGLMGFAVARQWWARIWPEEDRNEYGSGLGYTAARAVRGLAFALIFLPLVGYPAFMWTIALQLWHMITLPVRALAWLKAKLAPRRTTVSDRA